MKFLYIFLIYKNILNFIFLIKKLLFTPNFVALLLPQFSFVLSKHYIYFLYLLVTGQVYSI